MILPHPDQPAGKAGLIRAIGYSLQLIRRCRDRCRGGRCQGFLGLRRRRDGLIHDIQHARQTFRHAAVFGVNFDVILGRIVRAAGVFLVRRDPAFDMHFEAERAIADAGIGGKFPAFVLGLLLALDDLTSMSKVMSTRVTDKAGTFTIASKGTSRLTGSFVPSGSVRMNANRAVRVPPMALGSAFNLSGSAGKKPIVLMKSAVATPFHLRIAGGLSGDRSDPPSAAP